MKPRKIGTICALAAAALLPGSLAAQDAAETAVIVSGSGAGQAKASRSLGNAVSGSLDSAAGVIRSTQRARRPASRNRRSRNGGVRIGSEIPSGVDALEGTDAAAYKTDGGATIKFSGRFVPSGKTECDENCAKDDKPEE